MKKYSSCPSTLRLEQFMPIHIMIRTVSVKGEPQTVENGVELGFYSEIMESALIVMFCWCNMFAGKFAHF